MQRLNQGLATVLSWGLPASGLGVTLHFVTNGDWQMAILSGLTTVLVGTLTLGRRLLDRVVKRLGDRLDEEADTFADWLFDQGKVWLKQLWWKLTANFRDQYNTSLIYRYRDYRTQGLKTQGPFALDLERLFVPLRLRPESASRITGEMIGRPDSAGSWDIWQFLTAIKTQPAFDRLVILGAPGSGKTTLLEHLVLVFAKGTRRRKNRGLPNYIPVLLYLRDVRDRLVEDNPPGLPELIEQQVSLDGLTPPPDWFKEQLQDGKCLVMLDGLDEVADLKQRKQVSQWVNQQVRLYRENPFIITSRPFGYYDAPLEGMSTLEIKAFSLEQMCQFISNWYLQTEAVRHLGKIDPGVRQKAQGHAEDLIHRIQNTPSLAAMALNPLLLTMIVTVHAYRGALPGKRVELYAEICDVLLGRRQDSKGVPDLLTAEQKRLVLQSLALKLMNRRTRTFRLFAGKVLIEKNLATVVGKDMAAEDFIRQIETSSGLLVERHPGVYEFAHKSFQEYLAAIQIRTLKREYLLTRNIDDPWWEETIRLYAAQNDASNLIWAALQHNSVKALSVAYDCLEEAQSVSQDMRNELEGRLGAGLESSKPEIFELAAEVMLERRLKRMLRIDENTDIDLRYLSCAEYQLFLDEQRTQNRYLQPDQWADVRFPAGSAKAPVVGLRASDAQAFCAWLTQRINSIGSVYVESGVTVFAGPMQMRLPTAKELYTHPTLDLPLELGSSSSAKVASWSEQNQSLQVTFPLGQPEENHPLALLRQAIAKQLIQQILRDSNLVFDPILKHALALNNVLIYDQVELLVGCALEVREDPLHTRDRDLALKRLEGLDLHGREAAALCRDRELLLRLAEEWGKAVEQKAMAALNRNPAYRQAGPLLPAPEILLVCSFWRILAELYNDLGKRRRLLNRNVMVRPDCEFLHRQYQDYCEDVLRFYGFMALKEERRASRVIAWEGLRLVRAKR